MKKILCESIVYCDFLLIILLIVGVLIDNIAFVCYKTEDRVTRTPLKTGGD